MGSPALRDRQAQDAACKHGKLTPTSKYIRLVGSSAMRVAKSRQMMRSQGKGTLAPSSTSPRSCWCTCSPKLEAPQAKQGVRLGATASGGKEDCIVEVQ